jgi:hypothetical protein
MRYCAIRRSSLTIGLLLGAILTACAPGLRPHPQDSASSGVKIEDSEFEQKIKFVGIDQTYEPRSLNGTFASVWLIRSWMDKSSGKAEHQLYVSVIYNSNSWRLYSSANDQNAQSLRFTSINRDVLSCYRRTGCGYNEIFGVSIDDATLRAARNGGYCVKAYARSGDTDLFCLNRLQISAQLDAIDIRRPPTPQASASPSPKKIPGRHNGY